MALFLPDDFHVLPEDCLYRIITEEKECAALSQEIQKMCMDHGVDIRRSFYAALAGEMRYVNVMNLNNLYIAL